MSTEVTNAQYLRCVDAGTCDPPADSNRRYADAQFADQPVTGVTWFQARDYANWVGGRLPTEAEWEKACRGTDGRTYPWGNQDPTGDLLNYSETGLGTSNTVGSYPEGASPYGALDMAGNVWEWTSSAYEAISVRSKGSVGRVPDADCACCGAARSTAMRTTCAAPSGSYYNPDGRGDNIGFRVVVSPGF